MRRSWEAMRRSARSGSQTIRGVHCLRVSSAYSKWPEIIEMSTTTTSSTIKELRRLFAQFGNPQTLVTDNGPQFTSKDFGNFCAINGIRHLKLPPFNPQSNGQAERFVDTLKRNFQKLISEVPAPEALQRFLLTYRRTPCPSAPDGESPAEAFLGRTIHTTLSLLKPSTTIADINRNHKTEEQFNRHHGARQKEFSVGDLVCTLDYRSGTPKQLPARVLQRHGNRLYDVAINGQVWKRHADQMRLRYVDTPSPDLELSYLALLPCLMPAEMSPKLPSSPSSTTNANAKPELARNFDCARHHDNGRATTTSTKVSPRTETTSDGLFEEVIHSEAPILGGRCWGWSRHRDHNLDLIDPGSAPFLE